MQGRTKAVRAQPGGILALARGTWRAHSGVGSFLTAGLGNSGGEVLRAEVEDTGWQSLESPPRGWTEQNPAPVVSAWRPGRT